MSPRTRPERPNILFLMTDEHRFDLAGFAGNDVVRTPVLDRIAATGVVFDNAYTPSPVCIPGRQSLMAGQLPHTTGCRRFGEDLPERHETFARVLHRAGWETVACGKLHHTGVDQMQGWSRRPVGDLAVSRAASGAAARPPRPGWKWSQTKEVRRAGVGRGPYRAADEAAVRGALDVVDSFFSDPYYDRATPEDPLLLKVSLNQPHYPYLCDEELFTHYLGRVPVHTDEHVPLHPVLSRGPVMLGRDVSPTEVRRATAAYYAAVETADAMFGQVVERLEHHGQDLSEWIVVFTSDHGEMLGQHGLWEKQRFYEASVRVPLVIGWPAEFGHRRVRANVSLCDLFATLCELAGVPAPAGLDSRSLVPLLRGEDGPWDDEAVSEYLEDQLMIKRGALKYQHYGAEHPEVLFDLGADPDETRDLSGDPHYARQMALFRARAAELGYRTGES